MAQNLLPYDVKNALIEVCGRAFWYKQPLFDIFARAGIPEDMYLKYEHEAKFKIGRLLLGDLERMGADGLLLQRRLLAELCKLRNLPDNAVSDRAAGLAALRKLKEVAYQNDFMAKQESAGAAKRQSHAHRMSQQALDRRRRLKTLYDNFISLAASDDRQARGYRLEDLLSELFAVYEIQYRKSYIADGEQVDGFFTFGGFDYIVEARWRQNPPTLGELGSIKIKVERKIESTRGFVVSIAPFREDILGRLREAGPANLILMDGMDLTLILERRVTLIDALRAKVDKAAQEGIIFYPLKRLFS